MENKPLYGKQEKTPIDWTGSLKALILVIMVAIVSIPIFDPDKKNETGPYTLTPLGVRFPERFGYLGGLFNFDTLEVRQDVFLVKKGRILGTENLRIPIPQVRRIVFDKTFGQRYIKLEFEGGFLESSYRIYTKYEGSSDFVKVYLDLRRVIVEDNWD